MGTQDSSSVSITGGTISGLNSLALDTTPTGALSAQGQMMWNPDEETVDIQLNAFVMHTGTHMLFHVKNSTGSTIAKGVPVMFAGTNGSSGILLVQPWNGTGPSTYFMGITAEELIDTAEGFVIAFGKLKGIQTDGANYGETWVNGQIIYASTTTGYLTKTQPAAPNPHIQVCAVVNAHASNGTLFIRPTLGSNIKDNEGVTISSLSSGQILVANAAGTVFLNKSVSADATLADTGALTLATVNSNVGTFGSATAAPAVTVNAKGLVTAVSTNTITPAIGSVTGLGTGIATALGVNTGSAGAPVLFDGAGGTPSSVTLTNASGTAANLTAGQATAALGLKTATTTVSVSSATAPTAGQVLTATSSTAATWQSGGGSAWGGITGTLSDQTDLQTALNGKASTTHAASHTNGTDDIQSATASQKGLATAAQITKLDGIEALADVTDAANVGSSIAGATAVTTLDDADVLPIVTATPTLKKLAYSAFKTLLDALYQAKATILSTLSGLANDAGVLTNDGSGGLYYSPVSTGGAGVTDSGKLAVYNYGGILFSSKYLYIGDTSYTSVIEAPTGLSPVFNLPSTPTGGTFALTDQLTVSGLSGFGTGVADALAINTGSTGAPVLFNGNGGTPSAIVLTNASGTASLLIAGYATAARGLQCSSVTVNVLSAAAPTAGQVLTATSSTAATWQSVAWRESLALSDLSTALTASTSVVVGTYTFMQARTLSSINLSILTAPTGAALQVDTKKNGTTIWTTKPTIDAGEFSTLTAATPGVLATTSFAAGDVLTFYITQVGSTVAGVGLQAYMEGTF